MSDLVHTGFSRIKTEPIGHGQGGQSRGGSAHFEPPLLRGQLLEVAVARVSANAVWLEGKDFLLRASIPPGGAQVGERFLLRVIDPDASPPSLKLVMDGQLPASSLAGVSTFLRSLLFRHQPLLPTRQQLSTLLGGPGEGGAISPELRQLLQELQSWRHMPNRIDAAWVKEKLQNSGLFREAGGRLSAAGGAADLKSILVAMLSRESGPGKGALRAAIEGITSCQIKSLDSVLQGGVNYGFLLPFLEESWIEARISRDEEQAKRDQWQVYLRHHSEEMGQFSAEILLQKKSVSVLFRSDQGWLLELIQKNQGKLELAIEAAGLNLQQISAVALDPSRVSSYLEHEQHAIFDLRV